MQYRNIIEQMQSNAFHRHYLPQMSEDDKDLCSMMREKLSACESPLAFDAAVFGPYSSGPLLGFCLAS